MVGVAPPVGGGVGVVGAPPDGGAVEERVRMPAMPDRAVRARNIGSCSGVRTAGEGECARS